MERNEGWEAGILSMYLKIQFQMSKSKFLKSCISEGFLPNGVRGCFSLAMDVNNQGLIQSIEEEMDIHSSRLLDRIYIHSQELEIQLKTQRDEMIRTILVSGVLEDTIENFIKQMRYDCQHQVLDKERQLKKKLIKLRAEKRRGRLPPGWSQGSRRIIGFIYVRDYMGGRQGSRFPQNLRPHRRNRPHRKRYPTRSQHIVT